MRVDAAAPVAATSPVKADAVQFNFGNNGYDGRGAIVGLESTPVKLSEDGRRIMCVDAEGRLVRDDQGCTFRQAFIAQYGKAAYAAYRKPILKALLEERMAANALVATGVTAVPSDTSPTLAAGYAALAAATPAPVALATAKPQHRHTLTAPVLHHAKPVKGGVTTGKKADGKTLARGTAADVATAPKIALGSQTDQPQTLTPALAMAMVMPDMSTLPADMAAKKKALWTGIKQTNNRAMREMAKKVRAARDAKADYHITKAAAVRIGVGVGGVGLGIATGLALLALWNKRRKREAARRKDPKNHPLVGKLATVTVESVTQMGERRIMVVNPSWTGGIANYELEDEHGKTRTVYVDHVTVLDDKPSDAAIAVPIADSKPSDHEIVARMAETIPDFLKPKAQATTATPDELILSMADAIQPEPAPAAKLTGLDRSRHALEKAKAALTGVVDESFARLAGDSPEVAGSDVAKAPFGGKAAVATLGGVVAVGLLALVAGVAVKQADRPTTSAQRKLPAPIYT